MTLPSVVERRCAMCGAPLLPSWKRNSTPSARRYCSRACVGAVKTAAKAAREAEKAAQRAAEEAEKARAARRERIIAQRATFTRLMKLGEKRRSENAAQRNRSAASRYAGIREGVTGT